MNQTLKQRRDRESKVVTVAVTELGGPDIGMQGVTITIETNREVIKVVTDYTQPYRGIKRHAMAAFKFARKPSKMIITIEKPGYETLTLLKTMLHVGALYTWKLKRLKDV